MRVIKLNVVVKFSSRIVDCVAMPDLDAEESAGGRSVVIHHLAGSLIARRTASFSSFTSAPCSTNQRRDFIREIDRNGRFDRQSVLTRS